jgi:hypothetical protein
MSPSWASNMHRKERVSLINGCKPLCTFLDIILLTVRLKKRETVASLTS